jgi:hypothetical protein
VVGEFAALAGKHPPGCVGLVSDGDARILPCIGARSGASGGEDSRVVGHCVVLA